MFLFSSTGRQKVYAIRFINLLWLVESHCVEMLGVNNGVLPKSSKRNS